VLDSTNVPLEDLDFKAEMASRLGVPVEIDNDANVACLAEWRIGAARGARNVVMLTLGTGVGGGLVLDGRLYRGSIGSGAELGHVSIDENGPHCQGHCNGRGCLEVLASATGVMAAAQQIASDHPHGGLATARAAGEDLDARYIIDRARAGDEEAIRVFAIVGRHLGVGIANLVNVFNPEVVVIGGGVAAAGEALLAPAREEYERRVLKATAGARIVAAELGNDAGVLGAAALVL
jgi:glucokinase